MQNNGFTKPSKLSSFIIPKPPRVCGCKMTKEWILENISKDEKTGCWIWRRARNVYNYGVASDAGKVRMVHRRAYELWVGPIPEGLLACHHCDNPPCVNPDHIFIGTKKKNAHDMIQKGRHVFNKGRFSSTQIEAIKKDSRNHKEIGLVLGVSATMISLIKRGLRYKKEIQLNP